MGMQYNFRIHGRRLSNPGADLANRLPNKCLRSAVRPTASDSRVGKPNPTKQARQSNSKLNKLIPALLEERKGFGVLVTVTLTTVSRVAKQYLFTLLEQAEGDAKEETCTGPDETSQKSVPNQTQVKETAYNTTNEDTNEIILDRSNSEEREPFLHGQASEESISTSESHSMSPIAQPDGTGSENEGAKDFQIDQDIKKAMLNGRHISLLTSPFSAEEMQRMGSGFSSKKQGRKISQQIVPSNSRKERQTKSMDMIEITSGGNVGNGGDDDGSGGGGDGNSNAGGDDNDRRFFFSLIVILAVLIALFGFAAKFLDVHGSCKSIDQRNETS